MAETKLLKPLCLFLTSKQTLFGLKYVDLFVIDRFDSVERLHSPSLGHAGGLLDYEWQGKC